MKIKKIMRVLHLYLGIFTLPIGILLSISGLLLIFGANEGRLANVAKYQINHTV